MNEYEVVTLRNGRTGQLFRRNSPLLRHHYILSFPSEPTETELQELVGQGLRAARAKSMALLARSDSYTLIHNGHAARRGRSWHLHFVIHRGRSGKAWLYFLLSCKNLLQAMRF